MNAPETPEGSDGAPAAFPLHCLPPDAQAMAEGICQAVRVPASLAGPCVLGILSAAIGAGLEVQSGPKRTSRANLFIMASAESGSGKSEVVSQAAAPVYEFERELLERWKADVLPGAKAEVEMLQAEIGRSKKTVAPVENGEKRNGIRAQLQTKLAAVAVAEEALRPPVLCVEDVTTEKLVPMLSRPGETLFSVSSDAGAVVKNLLGRYSKGDSTDEGIYLKAWTGERVKVDRLGRDSVLLERPCLTALWCVQPDKVDALLSVQALSDGGLLPRLLLCHTGCEMREIATGNENTDPAPEAAESWRTLVRDLIEVFHLPASKAAIVQPQSEALCLLNEHYNGIVHRCRTGELRDVQSFAARWTEQAWRIALCLHAGTYGKEAGTAPLNAQTASCAIQLANWFSNQQLAILQKSRSERRLSRLEKLRSLIVSYGGEATLRDLVKNNGFAAEEVHRLAADYPAMLAVQRRDTGGRPSEVALIPGAATGYKAKSAAEMVV